MVREASTLVATAVRYAEEREGQLRRFEVQVATDLEELRVAIEDALRARGLHEVEVEIRVAQGPSRVISVDVERAVGAETKKGGSESQ